MSLLKKIDTRFGDNTIWQFAKFNLVSFSITLLQLALANLLPLIFDGVTAKLPPVIRPVFQPDTLFNGPSPYVVDGVVTWGYVLPLFPVKFYCQYLRLFHEYEDHIPRQGKPQRSHRLSVDFDSADPLFYLAARMDHCQIDSNCLCEAGQNHCRHSRRVCTGSGVVPIGKIRVV